MYDLARSINNSSSSDAVSLIVQGRCAPQRRRGSSAEREGQAKRSWEEGGPHEWPSWHWQDLLCNDSYEVSLFSWKQKKAYLHKSLNLSVALGCNSKRGPSCIPIAKKECRNATSIHDAGHK